MANIELNRKLLHLSSLWIPILISFAPEKLTSYTLFTCSILLVTIDLIKIQSTKLKIFFNKILNSVLREDERRSYFTGATYFTIGSYLTFLFFKWQVSVTAILILIISDTCASYIGINYGKVKFWHKSLEGSITFFTTTLIIINVAKYYFQFQYSILKLFYITIFTTLIELCSAKIYVNDNLSIPIVAGVCMSYLHNV